MAFPFPRGFDITDVAAAAFPKAEFKGIAFPFADISIKGAIRYAQHDFPHSPGAEIEKQGRKPYVITLTCPFHHLPGSQLDKQYPELYPTRLRQLRELFEKEITDGLVVPTIGTIPAVATSWTQTFNAQVATGETVNFEFIEDQDGSNAFNDQTLDYGITQLAELNDELLAAAARKDAMSARAQSVFQDISDKVTAVMAVAGQADAMSRLVEGKIQAVVNLCAFADGQLEDLQNPSNHLVLDALKDLWAASVSLAANVVETRKQLLTYRVPRLMGVNQIAASIYGSTDRSVEILQLNSFEDALAIPAGTLVVYPSP